MARAFVIRPFRIKTDSSGKEIDFEQIHHELIQPALEKTGLGGGTTGEIVEPGNVREDMFALILEADLVVCDITVHNANVFYELGIRHALRKQRTVLIKGGPASDSTPFDVLTDRYVAYEVDDPAAAKDHLTETITAALKSERETDSPIFKMLPDLTEADPSNVVVVPLDYREDVERARAANAKGWLRLLSEEVRDRRFQWEGLELVATAQWVVKDYDGARDSWEAIRETHPNDIAANLGLANIYERMYQDTNDPSLIESSDQAIERVIGNNSTSRRERTEALALKGRNQKTRWRLEFKQLETVEERRKAAMNRALIRSYKAYHNAFFADLNHFYPGLNALQMGTILSDLAETDAWYDAFPSDSEAESCRRQIEREVPSLRCLVPASVDAGLSQMSEGDPERVWAEISRADVQFLTDKHRKKRVIRAYRDAIPKEKPFAWDAARGQLTLFQDLGIQAELANKVIDEIDAHFADREPEAARKPMHFILFAGHRVDAPGRTKPRFPTEAANQVKAKIRSTVEKLLDDRHEVIGLASAAPGFDILAHEVCAGLNLNSKICLPMPTDSFTRFAFQGLDSWRTRFLDLQKDHDVIVLSNREGLPGWLRDSDEDPWERGNRWVMKMALASGADRITLIALWDGKETGDAPGGTAHMVRLAEDAGKVHINRIDSVALPYALVV